MSKIDILAPVFVRNRVSLDLLLGNNAGASLLSRLLAAVKQYACVVVATDSGVIEAACRTEGLETIFLGGVSESSSGLLPTGWQEAGDVYFEHRKGEHLLMIDLFHPFSYQPCIVEIANAWPASERSLIIGLEAPKDHPCQIDIHFSVRVEAMTYQPVRVVEKGHDTLPTPSGLNLADDINAVHLCDADECWVIPVIDGGARGDLIRVKILRGPVCKEEGEGFQFPPNTEACLLLWIRNVEPGDDPLVAPLGVASGPWKVGADGMRYLTDDNQPITGRQMFPEVLQISSAIIMARRDGWENMAKHVENLTFHPLRVYRNQLSDPKVNAALDLLGLLERL